MCRHRSAMTNRQAIPIARASCTFVRAWNWQYLIKMPTDRFPYPKCAPYCLDLNEIEGNFLKQTHLRGNQIKKIASATNECNRMISAVAGGQTKGKRQNNNLQFAYSRTQMSICSTKKQSKLFSLRFQITHANTVLLSVSFILISSRFCFHLGKIAIWTSHALVRRMTKKWISKDSVKFMQSFYFATEIPSILSCFAAVWSWLSSTLCKFWLFFLYLVV